MQLLSRRTLRVVTDSTPDPLRLAPDVVERGLRHVRRIRSQLGGHAPGDPADRQPTMDLDEPGDGGDAFDPAVMVQLMAAGAERDRLRQ
jgi:hypothetical protein